MFELTKMHKNDRIQSNGTLREGIVSEVEAFGERERVKIIKRKVILKVLMNFCH